MPCVSLLYYGFNSEIVGKYLTVCLVPGFSPCSLKVLNSSIFMDLEIPCKRPRSLKVPGKVLEFVVGFGIFE